MKKILWYEILCTWYEMDHKYEALRIRYEIKYKYEIDAHSMKRVLWYEVKHIPIWYQIKKRV